MPGALLFVKCNGLRSLFRICPVEGAALLQGRIIDEALFGAESPAYVAVRWIQYLGLVLMTGATAFPLLVLQRRVVRDSVGPSTMRTLTLRCIHVGLIGSAIVLGSAWLRLLAQAYAMDGTAAAFTRPYLTLLITTSAWGVRWAAQVLAAIIAIAGFLILRALLRRAPTVQRGPSSARWPWIAVIISVVGIAFTPGLSSHAAAMPDFATLAMMLDGLHVLAAGGWIGGIAVLLLMTLPGTSPIARGLPLAARATMVRAFSALALVSASLLAMTGTFAAWRHVGQMDALWLTPYGRTLLVKLGLLAGVACVGAYNWRRVAPAMDAAVSPRELRTTAMFELTLGLVVLLATALLVATPTPSGMTSVTTSGLRRVPVLVRTCGEHAARTLCFT